MAFSLSTLPAFTQQQDAQIGFIHKALLSAKTATLVRKIPGILGPVSIPFYDVDVQLQPFACTTGGQVYQGSGSITIKQSTVTPASIMVGQTVCAQDLQSKFTEYLLKPTEYQDSIPFEQEVLDFYALSVAAVDEQVAWCGNTTSTNNNLSQVNGFLQAISSSLGGGLGTTGYVSGSTHYSASSGSPITASNVIAVFDGIYQSLPATIIDKEDVFIACGQEIFNTYLIALRNANLYNFPPDQKDRVVVVPGTNVKVYALNGLNNAVNTTYSIVAGRFSNFVKVISAESDLTNMKADYNDFNELIQLKMKYLVGYGIGYAPEVVWSFNGQ